MVSWGSGPLFKIDNRELKQQWRRRLKTPIIKKWFSTASNFIMHIPSHLICQMLANFFGVEFLRTLSKFKKRKRKLLSNDCSRPRQNAKIRHFHIVVMQQRLKNVQKRVMCVQNCCFANINLLLFCYCSCLSFLIEKRALHSFENVINCLTL